MSDEGKIKYGLENVHVAKLTEKDGVITYGTPFKIPGAVDITVSAEGEITKFYADNIVYYKSVGNQGYSGSLEVAKIPDQFSTEIMGQEEDSNGALLENADDTISRFALMGEFKNDVKKRRFVYYDCVATRPEQSHHTQEENTDPQTDTLDIEMSPRTTDKMVKAVMELNDTNSEIFDTWYDEVYEKNAEASV